MALTVSPSTSIKLAVDRYALFKINTGNNDTTEPVYTAEVLDEAGQVSTIAEYDSTWHMLTAKSVGSGKLKITATETNESTEIPFEISQIVDNVFTFAPTVTSNSVELGNTLVVSPNLPSDVTTYTATVTPADAGTFDPSTNTFTPAKAGKATITLSATKTFRFGLPGTNTNVTLLISNTAYMKTIDKYVCNMYVMADVGTSYASHSNKDKIKYDPNNGLYKALNASTENRLGFTMSAYVEGELKTYSSEVRFNGSSSGATATNIECQTPVTKEATIEVEVTESQTVDPGTTNPPTTTGNVVTKEKVIVLVGSYAVPDITSTYTTNNNGVFYTAIDTYTASLQDEAGATTDVVTWDDTWKTLTGVKEGKGKLILTPSDSANDTLEIPFEVVTQVNNTFEITATPDKTDVKLGETQTWSVNLPSDVTTYTATVTPSSAGTYDTTTHTFTPAVEGAYSIEFSATKNYYYKVPNPSANITIMMKNSAVVALASMGRNMYVIATNNGDTNAAKHKFDPNTGCHIAVGVAGGNNLNYTISAVIDGETVNWTHSQIRFNAGSSGSKASNYAATKDLTKTVTVQASVVSDTVIDPDTPPATITVTPDTDLVLDLNGSTEVTKTFTVSATNYNVTVTPTDGGSYNTTNHTFTTTKAGSYSLVFTDTDTQATTTLTVKVIQSVVDRELIVTPGANITLEEGQAQTFVVSESTYTAIVSPTTLGTIDTTTGIFTAGTAGSGSITFSANTGSKLTELTVNVTVTAKSVDPTPVTKLEVTPTDTLNMKVGTTQVFDINYTDTEYNVSINPENSAIFDKATKTLTVGTIPQAITVTFTSIKTGDSTVIPVNIIITQLDVTSVALSKYTDTTTVDGAEVEVIVNSEAQDYTLSISDVEKSVIEIREDKPNKTFYVRVLDTVTGEKPMEKITINVLAKVDGKLEGSATFVLTIEDKLYTTTLDIAPSTITMQVGSESTVVITTNAEDFTFSNSNSNVVTFEKNTRKLYANAVGSSAIIFTAKNKTGTAVSKTLTVNVEAAPVVETTLVVTPTGPVSMVNGDSQQFVVATNADDYTVDVLDTSIATYTKEDNILRSVGAGETTVTFRATRKDSIEKTVEVVVNVSDSNISTDVTSLTISKGETKSFNISSNITNEVIATVSEAGKVAVTKKGSMYIVEAIDVGNVVITLTGRNKTITIPVTIIDTTTLSVTPQTKDLIVGNTYKATVTTNAPTFQVESTPIEVVTVNISNDEPNRILITPVSGGDATITVKATALGGEIASVTWKVTVVVKTNYTKEEATAILTDSLTTVAEKISKFNNDIGDYGNYVARLIQYNTVMSPNAETTPADERGATRNYNLYIQIKDTISKEDYAEFKAEFDIINMVFLNFAKDAYDEFALFRYDQAWSAKWGNDSLTTFQNLCTVICSLCDIKTRASNLDSINLDKALDITENDISELALNNIKKYYTV